MPSGDSLGKAFLHLKLQDRNALYEKFCSVLPWVFLTPSLLAWSGHLVQGGVLIYGSIFVLAWNSCSD